MKTSNKLLLALGILLFVVPISAISYIRGKDRVNQEEYTRIIEQEASSLNAVDVYLTTHETPNFNTVHINGENKRIYTTLHLIKSSQFGIKIEKGHNDATNYTISDGVLHINIPQEKFRYHITLYIFAPDIDTLGLSNLDIQKIKTDMEGLTLVGDNILGKLNIDSDKLRDLSIELKKSNVSSVYERNAQKHSGIQKIKLKADSSHIGFQQQHYNAVNVHAINSSVFFFDADEKVLEIDSLTLLTEGKCNININKRRVNNVEGILSDSTTIDLPIGQLRKLLVR